jgi:spore maturation protein CgeB
MSQRKLDIVFLGLSITSSWGNGHATTYRSLVRGLAELGHRVLFLERDVPWYAEHRDLPRPVYCRTHLYGSIEELENRFSEAIRRADLVVVGSFVPEGVALGEWVLRVATGVTAFYDIDTPITLGRLDDCNGRYITRELMQRYDMYLSFTGGPILDRLESEFGARNVRPLYCSVDAERYYPETAVQAWDLGYMGTYSADRQPNLDRLLLGVARRRARGRFVVAGPQYPALLPWPGNVARIEHLPPRLHRSFYNGQRFTLNVTRGDMINAGFSPSVRLFEAAACGVPIISDAWNGLETFFRPGEEIFIAEDTDDVCRLLWNVPARVRLEVARAARARVLRSHTSRRRAMELLEYTYEVAEVVEQSEARAV